MEWGEGEVKGWKVEKEKWAGWRDPCWRRGREPKTEVSRRASEWKPRRGGRNPGEKGGGETQERREEEKPKSWHEASATTPREMVESAWLWMGKVAYEV